jgi:hypothetical protein
MEGYLEDPQAIIKSYLSWTPSKETKSLDGWHLLQPFQSL